MTASVRAAKGRTDASTVVEVFADVSCPFAHVGLRRFVEERARRGRPDVHLWIRAWPLELVNGAPLEGGAVAHKAAVLRSSVAPGLFRSVDPDRFPLSTLPALALTAAAGSRGVQHGEAFGLAARDALFEEGLDIGDPEVLAMLAARCGLPGLVPDHAAVVADWSEGRRRGVQGSPHFFARDAAWFCPALVITHHDGDLEVGVDGAGFDGFTRAVFG